MAPVLKNCRGQTSVEYLLLLAATFVTGYIMVTKSPMADFTKRMVVTIRGSIQSIVLYGENDTTIDGASDNKSVSVKPSDPQRLKALH